MTGADIYHVFSKSIAGYTIFRYDSEFLRMMESIQYYRAKNPPIKYSLFKEYERKHWKHSGYLSNLNHCSHEPMLVRIIAYCLMPTHLHFVLEPLVENGISRFMGRLLNSYTRYFNIRHERKGPLWEGKYKKVLVETEEQLLHLTRYVHLNPVTAYLVNKPEEWSYSSYNEYTTENAVKICDFGEWMDMGIRSYVDFVNDRINGQREFALIKDLTLEG
ncbi:MAG: hypothetical protein A3C36_06385 [Omnitrophica WOR_2 bacterium RIFCSPHIGHO2_02_FULL_52_10]|nr:MAG: hypothetical protein A3C36_06385 [Omnitrophica WOR_2 bacterium RIFCSPHIGHO2_02_FULL_52_10]